MQSTRIRCARTVSAMALVLAGLGMLAGRIVPAGTVLPRTVVRGQLRASAAAAPAATGSFAENVTNSRSGGRTVLHGALIVKANRLAPRTTYGINVSGVRLGTLATDGAGNGRTWLLAVPRGRAQVLTIDPRGRQIALSDVNGEDMLNGEIDDPTTVGGIRCCLSTADQQGCDSLLADECAALGGTDLGAGSCEPDPCPQQGDDDGGADGEADDDAHGARTD